MRVSQLLGYSNINYCKQNVFLYPSSTLKKCLKNHASEKWDEFKKEEEKKDKQSLQKNLIKKRKKCSEKKAKEEKIKNKKIKWNSSEIYNYRRTNVKIVYNYVFICILQVYFCDIVLIYPPPPTNPY